MSIWRVSTGLVIIGMAALGLGNAAYASLGSEPGAVPQVITSGGSEGEPIGSRFPIRNDASLVEIEPAIAYNPERQEYLVVWYNDRPGNDDIRAQRVARDGRLVGSPFYVSAGTGADRRHPDVAYNSHRKEYLVVWEQEDSTGTRVVGRRVSDSGVVQGTQDIIYASNPAVAISYYQPAVAYATTEDSYLLVLRYDNGGMGWQTITAISLTSDASSDVWIPVTAWDTPDLPEQPDVAYNRSRNEFLVTWQQKTGGSGNFDVYARRVKMSGGADTAGAAFAVASTTRDETTPAVAAVPTTPNYGQYLVAWEDEGDVRARAVAGDGTPGTTFAIATLNGWTESMPAVGGSEGRQAFLVVWSYIITPAPPATMQVYGRTVEVATNMLGDAKAIGGLQIYDPAVAAGDAGDFLVAFDDNVVAGTSNRGIYGRLWGTRVYLPLVTRSS